MVAAPAARDLRSSRRHPCPVCGRADQEGDCEMKADGRVFCHWGSRWHPPEWALKPGDHGMGADGNAWAYLGDSEMGNGIFKPHQPLSSTGNGHRQPSRVVPLRRTPKPAPLASTLTLATLPDGAELPDLNRERAAYHYSPTQQTRRNRNGKGGKVKPYYREGEAQKPGAGPDPWPLFQQQNATTANGWPVETEGERCAGLVMAAGLVGLCQPGHDFRLEQITRRYRELVAAGVPGVVYLSDHDAEGTRKATVCAEAAAIAGLPFLHLPAAEVWPGIPEKGSIDDAAGTPEDHRQAITEAAARKLRELTEPAIRQQAAPPTGATILDELLGPAEEGKLRRPQKDTLTAAMDLVLALRFNLLTQRIERDGEPIDGDFLSTLYLELAEAHRLDVAKDRAADAAIRLSRRHAYHPVRDYLEGLTVTLTPEQWAGLDVHFFGREDPSGWGCLHLQRQLIGLVARAMEPGCELHTCLVIQSDRQGIGKSSLWKILGGEWFSDSLGDLRDVREDRLQLHSAWIHEWGEIDNVLGKRESETLKRFISCSRDDVRKPYGRGTEQLRRSCGLVGTTNRRDFIKDPTGNRRFPIIPIREVRLDWITEHRDAIWGSALQAYRNQQRWHYDHNETAFLNQHAAAFAAEDPLRAQLETWLEDHPEIKELPVAHAVWGMGYPERMRDREFCRQVSNAFRSIGWTRTPGQDRRYWLPNGERTDKAAGWIRPT